AQPSIRRVEQNPSTLIVATAADAVFNERRLAEIYGPLEPDRPERAKAVKVTPYKGVNYAAIMQAGLEADTARRAKCGPNVLRSVALRGRRGLPQPTVASCRCCSGSDLARSRARARPPAGPRPSSHRRGVRRRAT